MAKTRVKEALARPARTAIQMTPAGVVTEVVDSLFYNFDDRQYAAVFALLTLLLAYGQNAIEDANSRGWWFRSVPPDNQPVAGD